jgi:methyl-accepting chemotaxis protein
MAGNMELIHRTVEQSAQAASELYRGAETVAQKAEQNREAIGKFRI